MNYLDHLINRIVPEGTDLFGTLFFKRRKELCLITRQFFEKVKELQKNTNFGKMLMTEKYNIYTKEGVFYE